MVTLGRVHSADRYLVGGMLPRSVLERFPTLREAPLPAVVVQLLVQLAVQLVMCNYM